MKIEPNTDFPIVDSQGNRFYSEFWASTLKAGLPPQPAWIDLSDIVKHGTKVREG